MRREGYVDGKTSPPTPGDEEERREDNAGSQSRLRDRSACLGLPVLLPIKEVLSHVATARTTSDFNHSSVFKQLGES
jgi:hypothetical protein